MSLTEKYGIIMKYDQFGTVVPQNFEDSGEAAAIALFEKYVLELKKKNKDQYTMIELGSNYAYYSMLFKKIIEPAKSFNLLVEPYQKYMKTGQEHFQINNLEGTFLEEKINNPKPWCGRTFDCPSTTIDELVERYDIVELDVLHSDSDQNEVLALDGAKESLKNKKIDTLFIMTHAETDAEANASYGENGQATKLHKKCKGILMDYGYILKFDHPQCTMSGDGMLIFKR